MTESERIDFLIRHLELNNAKNFAARLGVVPSSVSRIRSGKTPLGQKYVESILETYPQVSREWLETGEGYPGDLSADLAARKYEELKSRTDGIIDSLLREIERQGRVIDALLAEREGK